MAASSLVEDAVRLRQGGQHVESSRQGGNCNLSSVLTLNGRGEPRAILADTLGMRGLVESALARSYPEILRSDQETQTAYEAYVARFLTNDPTSYAFILRALFNVNFDGILEKIECPTLFVSGRHDFVRTPATTAAVVPRVKGSRFLEIEGGHIPSIQAPAALAAALGDFFQW